MPCDRCGGEECTTAGRDSTGAPTLSLWSLRTTADGAVWLRLGPGGAPLPIPRHVSALAVRHSLRFRLPDADLAELLAERGVQVDPSTSFDWVQQFTPQYQEAARLHRRRVRQHWSIDETYIRIAGQWYYAFRAIDEDGHVSDVFVSPTRDTAAATTCLTQAVERTGVTPDVATTDRAAIYPPALAAVLPEVTHVRGKLCQQRIARDHQHLKGRTRAMRGFQTLPCAQVICGGHGFVRNLRNGFYDRGRPVGDPRRPQAPRLVRAWDELTLALAAAELSPP